MGSLSFGKGAFQACWGRASGASLWYYRDAHFFYALEVDRNDINKKYSVMFIPPFLPVTLLFFSGELHFRTRFFVSKEISFFSKSKEHNMHSKNEEIVTGFFNASLLVKPHRHFCFSEDEKTTIHEIDFFIMKNATPLKMKRNLISAKQCL